VIECWKKPRKKILKKFVGRVAIQSSQLDGVDQIKGWYDLGGRGKSSEIISGKLYIRAMLPGKPKSLNQQVAEQRSKRITALPAPTQPGIVFDRTQELLGRAQPPRQAANTQRQRFTVGCREPTQPQQIVRPKSAQKEEHQIKVEFISKLNAASEKELVILQEKMKQYESAKDKAITRRDMEEIVNSLKDSIHLGMTTLREVGESLNHNGSEQELRVKMQQSNYLLHQLTVIIDNLNVAQMQLKEQNIL